MKLHGKNLSILVDDALDHTVIADASDGKPLAQAVDRLMVGAVGHETLPVQVRQQGMGGLNFVDAIGVGNRIMAMPLVGKILHQRAARATLII